MSHKIFEKSEKELFYPFLNISNNKDIEGLTKVMEVYS